VVKSFRAKLETRHNTHTRNPQPPIHPSAKGIYEQKQASQRPAHRKHVVIFEQTNPVGTNTATENKFLPLNSVATTTLD
jgi:L-rhamnose mutarotase